MAARDDPLGQLAPAQRVNQEEVAELVGLSVAPVREALRVLEQEGQVTYRPRRGYFVTELRAEDLEEIYELRQRARGAGRPAGAPDARRGRLERIALGRQGLLDAAAADDVIAELEANRRFHFAHPRLPRPAPHDAPDPPAVGLDRGLPGDVLQLAGRAPPLDRGPRPDHRPRCAMGMRTGWSPSWMTIGSGRLRCCAGFWGRGRAESSTARCHITDDLKADSDPADRHKPMSRLLIAMRYVLPAAVVFAGVIVMAFGSEADLEGGAGIISAGLAIYAMSWLYRASVDGDRIRDEEEAARDYLDLHGHWPDEPPREEPPHR